MADCVSSSSPAAFDRMRQSVIQEAKRSAKELVENTRAESASQRQRKQDVRMANSGYKRAVHDDLMQPRHNHELYDVDGEDKALDVKPRPKAKPSAGAKVTTM